MPRKPTYKKLEQRVKELEQSNQELRQFACTASQDLQEPLDIVTRYLQFVEARYKDRLGPDDKEFIASAVDGANKIQSLITDQLAYFRRLSPQDRQ
jgi:light-regulated signal transduction histidine kinase (bacteriophytochrome)